jgi:hypothetical protein
MEVLIGISCFILGCVVTRFIFRTKPIGTLKVDESDPEDGPYLFLELSTNPNAIKQKQYVTLKVDTKSYISQK